MCMSDDFSDGGRHIGMAPVENAVDEPECCTREVEAPDREDIEDAAEWLIHGMPYAGM